MVNDFMSVFARLWECEFCGEHVWILPDRLDEEGSPYCQACGGGREMKFNKNPIKKGENYDF